MNLSQNANFEYAGAAVANASNTDSNSTRYDMSGFDGILFLTTITDCADTGVATLTVEQNDSDSDVGMAAITGASASITATADDSHNGKTLIVDVFRPLKRYTQGVRTSAIANIAFGEIHAVRYSGRVRPVAAAATKGAITTVVGS